MKKIIAVALCAVSLSAVADSWTMPNTGGGQVVLTDRKCPGHPALLEAYTYTGSVYLEGCWTVLDNKVHVAWQKGQGVRVYELGDFTPAAGNGTKKRGTSL